MLTVSSILCLFVNHYFIPRIIHSSMTCVELMIFCHIPATFHATLTVHTLILLWIFYSFTNKIFTAEIEFTQSLALKR